MHCVSQGFFVEKYKLWYQLLLFLFTATRVRTWAVEYAYLHKDKISPPSVSRNYWGQDPGGWTVHNWMPSDHIVCSPLLRLLLGQDRWLQSIDLINHLKMSNSRTYMIKSWQFSLHCSCCKQTDNIKSGRIWLLRVKRVVRNNTLTTV